MMNINNYIKKLTKDKNVRPIDVQFAKQMLSFSEKNLNNSEMKILAELTIAVSNEFSKGNICVPLQKVMVTKDHFDSVEPTCTITILKKSGICGNGDIVTPLVLSNDCIYIYRNWLMEQQVSKKIKELSAPIILSETRIEQIRGILDKLFAKDTDLLLKLIYNKNENETFLTVMSFLMLKKNFTQCLRPARYITLLIRLQNKTLSQNLQEF